MSLAEQIEQDFKTALKAGQSGKVSTLRLLKTALKNQQISQKVELSDADVTKVIQKEAKQRRDSIESYQAAGRKEMAEQESSELAILEAYLPTLLDEQALAKLIDDVIAETGASSMSDMGKVMQAVNAKAAGAVDGAAAAKLVRQKLG